MPSDAHSCDAVPQAIADVPTSSDRHRQTPLTPHTLLAGMAEITWCGPEASQLSADTYAHTTVWPFAVTPVDWEGYPTTRSSLEGAANPQQVLCSSMGCAPACAAVCFSGVVLKPLLEEPLFAG